MPRRCRLSWRALHCALIVLAVQVLGARAADATTTPTPPAACDVPLPDNGGMGDCPTSLASGASCEIACDPPYLPNRTSTDCLDGVLSPAECIADACEVSDSDLPSNGDRGDCPQVLPDGELCQPSCLPNHDLSGNLTCAGGNLSTVNVSCVEGPTTATTTATTTTVTTAYARCPLPHQIWDGSRGACRCDRASFRVPGLSEVSCKPCPKNSHVFEDREGQSVKDCACDEGYIMVLPEVGAENFTCRLPFPCNISDFVERMNFTGPNDEELAAGSCNRTTLKHGEVCRLTCRMGRSPQVGSDFFSAPDLTIHCSDGSFDEYPSLTNLWCSETSFETPPLVFLAVVTLAALCAGCRMEWRRKGFERSVAQALRGPDDAASPQSARKVKAA